MVFSSHIPKRQSDHDAETLSKFVQKHGTHAGLLLDQRIAKLLWNTYSVKTIGSWSRNVRHWMVCMTIYALWLVSQALCRWFMLPASISGTLCISFILPSSSLFVIDVSWWATSLAMTSLSWKASMNALKKIKYDNDNTLELFFWTYMVQLNYLGHSKKIFRTYGATLS